MKYLFQLILLNTVLIPSMCQTRHSVSLGPDLGIPTESFGKVNLGLGGSLEYNMVLKGKIGPQIHIGYQRFTSKVYSDHKVTFLPIRIGLIGFIYQDIFFVSADAGRSRYYSPTTDTEQNGFTFGIGAGSKLPLSGGQFMQVSVYFNRHHFEGEFPGQEYNYNWFNIRAAYGISWGKKTEKE